MGSRKKRGFVNVRLVGKPLHVSLPSKAESARSNVIPVISRFEIREVIPLRKMEDVRFFHERLLIPYPFSGPYGFTEAVEYVVRVLRYGHSVDFFFGDGMIEGNLEHGEFFDDDVSAKKFGELHFFPSAEIFQAEILVHFVFRRRIQNVQSFSETDDNLVARHHVGFGFQRILIEKKQEVFGVFFFQSTEDVLAKADENLLTLFHSAFPFEFDMLEFGEMGCVGGFLAERIVNAEDGIRPFGHKRQFQIELRAFGEENPLARSKPIGDFHWQSIRRVIEGLTGVHLPGRRYHQRRQGEVRPFRPDVRKIFDRRLENGIVDIRETRERFLGNHSRYPIFQKRSLNLSVFDIPRIMHSVPLVSNGPSFQSGIRHTIALLG